MNSTFADYVFKDLKTVVPLSFILIFIGLFLLLGNLWMASGVLITNIMASASAIGIGGYLGITLTTPSSMAPTIILTLTVADCLHIALGALKKSSEYRKNKGYFLINEDVSNSLFRALLRRCFRIFMNS